jgi:hypothetical protein
MKTSHKVALGVGAVVVGALVVRHYRRGKAHLELTVSRDASGNCVCEEVARFPDGRIKTIRVPLARCKEQPNLATEVEQCANNEGPFAVISDAAGTALSFFFGDFVNG